VARVIMWVCRCWLLLVIEPNHSTALRGTYVSRHAYGDLFIAVLANVRS
jgi:hypothetical protein